MIKTDIVKEKEYRVQSVINFPNDSIYNKCFADPTIQSSRESVAGQIFLLNSVNLKSKPVFNTVILPEWKTVFFSDYSVLWSFKIGSGWFFCNYFLVLIMLSYTIFSLLVILCKSIKLKEQEKRSFYKNTIVCGLNMLLAVMLVQYVYTFLTNFWTLPLTGQSAGLLSPVYFEYIFHVFVINYLYGYFTNSANDRQEKLQGDTKNIYTKTKLLSLLFPAIFFVISILLLYKQQTRINKVENEISWKILQETDVNSLIQRKKENTKNKIDNEWLLDSAYIYYNKFQKDKKNKNAQKEYKNYLLAYYESNNIKKEHKIHKDYFCINTNFDGITAIRKDSLRGTSDFYYYKFVNGNRTLFVPNKYYGGCPPDAETVDFKLQEKLNRELEAWANEINKNAGFKMVAGSILVAKNATGEIQASASFPLMYNENDYHVLHKKAELNNDLKKYKVGVTDETVEIKFSKEANYINFAESDMMQGSIVKPLLAYYYLASGLPYSENDLNALLGYSNNQIAEKLFRNLFEKNDYFNKADSVYRNDFGFSVYNNGFEKDKAYVSHAIGQQQKLIFKDIVQAYIRIKEGKNVKLSYKKSNTSFENLSLNDVQLDILRNAMKVCLKNGTAKDIGKKTGTSNKEYLAKTGTA